MTLAVACKDNGDDTAAAGDDGGAGDGGTELISGDLLWLTTGGGPGEDLCSGVAEATGGVLVAACTTHGFSTWADGTAGETSITSVGGFDVLFLGLDATDGSILWHVQVASDEDDGTGGGALTSLADGRVAALISLGGPATLDGASLEDATQGDVALLVITADGTVDTAALLTSGPVWNDVVSMSLDALPGGGMLAAVAFEDGITLVPGGDGATELSAEGDWDTVVAWLDADLGLERSVQLSAPGGMVAAQAAVAGDGVHLVGTLLGSLTLGQLSPMTLESWADTDNGDAFAASLDSDGEPSWGLVFGSDGWDYARVVEPTPDGGMVTAGLFGWQGDVGTLGVPGLAGDSLTVADRDAPDAFVLGLDGSGTPQWVQGMATEDYDSVVDLDAFDSGAVAASAWIDLDGGSTTLSFSDGGEAPVDGRTAALVRYEADGTRSWTRLVDGSYAIGIRVLADGRVAQAHLYNGGAVFGEGEINEVEATSAGQVDGAVSMHRP